MRRPLQVLLISLFILGMVMIFTWEGLTSDQKPPQTHVEQEPEHIPDNNTQAESSPLQDEKSQHQLIANEELFQRVFWSPLADTRILQQHYQDLGNQRARYFFQIAPDPAFFKRVWEENSFRLHPIQELTPKTDQPLWFKDYLLTPHIIRSSMDGSMDLIYNTETDLVYATGVLSGFKKGKWAGVVERKRAKSEKSSRVEE